MRTGSIPACLQSALLKSNRPKKFCYNKIVPSVQTRISLSGYLRGGDDFVLSEFCRSQAMQIAVGIDRHRCLVAQLKNRSGCLVRMEITDVAALRRFHIEPLDNTDYPIFHLCYPLQLPIYRHKDSILPPVRKGTDAKAPAGNCSQGLGLCAGVPHTGITVIQFR